MSEKTITKKEYLQIIETGVKNELEVHKASLPKDLNTQRFALNCIAVVNENLDKFKGVTPESVVTALAKGAYLGLDFFNRECYAIPYKGVVNFQTDYKGEIKLCKKYSKNPIKDIYAKLVRKGDDFEESVSNGVQTVNFRPIPFNGDEIIGAFAVVLYKDGSMIYDTMSKDEIEKTRNTYSKAKDSQAWKDSTGEMYKKTVLRRICKMIDLDFDNIDQRRAFDEGAGVVFDETPSKVLRKGEEESQNSADVLGVVDVEYSEVEEPAEEYPDADELPFA